MIATRARAYEPGLHAHLGPCHVELAHRWVQGGAEVWRVHGRDASYALKIHTLPDKFEHERRAYEQWLDRLDPHDPIVPKLVVAFEGDPGALLTTWVEAVMATTLEDAGQEQEIYAAAGRCLARLHGASPRTSAAQASKHRQAVLAKTVSRARQLTDEIGEDVARWAITIAESPQWDALPLGYCHRDYSPRNWLVGPGSSPRVTVIDFEFSALDYLAVDVMKLWDGPFVSHLPRKAAFYQGYGIEPEAHLTALRLLAPSHGLAIVAWSKHTNNPTYLEHGKRFLARCAANPDWMLEAATYQRG